MESDLLLRGRECFQRRAWRDAFRFLDAADREAALAVEDLERLADTAYLIGRDDESESFRARAHQEFLRLNDRQGAARAAFWLAFGLLQRGAAAPAAGWFVRAERLLDEPPLDCVVRGYLLIPRAIQRLIQGDMPAALADFTRAAEIAGRFGDRDLAALTCEGRGRVLLRSDAIDEGLALLDESMAAVVAGDISPIVAGDVYCAVLEGCNEVLDLRRAYEWTVSLARWCAAQPDLVRYRGECLLYRAEMLQWRGTWDEAERDARAACELLTAPRRRPAAGAACYRLGELHRLRGHLAEADTAFRQANEWGRKPQPGLSLLRLAEGQLDAAVTSIRTALAETPHARSRARLLPAAVEIFLAGGDVEAAAAAAAELSALAIDLRSPVLSAAAAHADGTVRFASGDVAGGTSALRRAWEGWRDLEMPFEEAQARVLIAGGSRQLGDHDGARIELDAARRILVQLGAQRDAARVAEIAGADARHGPGPLSDREAQVLRLVAAGKTNRAIADELFISEKTVARHVSNIFDKLGVSSRSGATAWAYRRNLV